MKNAQPGEQRSPVPAIRYSRGDGPTEDRGRQSSPVRTALKSGSSAMEICEPCQVRNEAALSGSFHVPEGRLGRAGQAGNGCLSSLEADRAFMYDGTGVKPEMPLEDRYFRRFIIFTVFRSVNGISGFVPQVAAEDV